MLAIRNSRESITVEVVTWCICAGLTALSAGVALVQVRKVDDLIPALVILPPWMVVAAILSATVGLATLAVSRDAHPTRTALEFLNMHRRPIALAFVFIGLAGLNMVTFMWIKPQLNRLVPFSAGPMLADIDQALFLGHEPWRLLQFANVPFAGLFYHPGWFATIALALVVATFAAPTPRRSAVLTSYFLLWSLVGPLVHIQLPAAGPLFYEALGYGPRFADLPRHDETAAVADFLWSYYASGSVGAGNGISAMPSMHVATSSWVVLTAHALRPKLLPFALLSWSAIFILSIALGWHYAVDGIVGALSAITCYVAMLALFVRIDNSSDSEFVPSAA